MDSSSINRIGDIITFLKPSGKAVSLVVGETVKAVVLNMVRDGTVSLRIGREVITARSDIPFTKGDVVFLNVLGIEKDLKLRFVGLEGKSLPQNVQTLENRSPENAATVPARIFKMLSEFSDVRLKSQDIQAMNDLFRSIPDEVRSSFPQLRALENILSEIEHLNSEGLKASVENSGILFETRLKLVSGHLSDEESETPTSAPPGEGIPEKVSPEGRKDTGGIVENDHILIDDGKTPGAIKAKLPTETHMIKDGQDPFPDTGIREDLKGQLLQAKATMRDEGVIESLRMAGIRPQQISEAIDRLTRNIEFFQLTSRVNSMMYTFLPLSWQGLKDGEVVFKKSRDGLGTADTYHCTLNLDLESAGKLSISVTLLDKAFYVSFRAEKDNTVSLLHDHKDSLEKRFSDAGLTLKAINLMTENVVFGRTKGEGLHVRI